MRFNPIPLRRNPRNLLACALMALACALPAAAQEDGAGLLAAIKARAGAAASAASAAAAAEAPASADPALVQRAARNTEQGDARILADLTARLARNPAFADVRPTVQAGVARLAGSVDDSEARQLATKLAGAVAGVVAVENELTLRTRFGVRLADTVQIAKDRLARTVALAPLLLVALLIVWLANLAGRWLANHLQLMRLDSRNPYLGTLMRRVVRAACALGGVLVALDLLQATALVTAVLGSAGVVGIVLGFAFRDVAENYLSGILLSLRRPFEPGDQVRIDSYEGRVVSLSTRNTVLMTPDGNELRLPNATVFKAVLLNFTHNPRRRFNFQLNVGSGEDLRAAQELGVATLAAMQGVLADPGPSAAIVSVGDSSVAITYNAWVNQRETDFTKARSEGIRLVKLALEQAGMDLPEPIYRVQLTSAVPQPAAATPSAAPAPTADDIVNPEAVQRTQGDVSPSDELDDQIAQERARKADKDMLRAPGSRAE